MTLAPRLFVPAGVLLILLSSGCGDHGVDIGPPDPPSTPLNTTPQNLLARFEAMFEQQNVTEYRPLFTADFTFHFSPQSDPLLATEYGSNWGKDDELESAGHLFDGFTSSEPPFETFGPATNITLVLEHTEILPDPSHTDSSRFYKFVVPTAHLEIAVAGDGGGFVYEIVSPHHFYLVRGDVAHLDADQPADSLRWYIRAWDDMSSPPGGFTTARSPGYPGRDVSLTRTMPTQPASWGSIKATYR